MTYRLFLLLLLSAGILVAAIYYVLELRHQARMRQTDLVMRLYSTFGSTEFQKAWQRFMTTEYNNYDDFVENMVLGHLKLAYF